MVGMKLNISGNEMIDGESIASLPNNFEGEATVTNNKTHNVKHGVFVRDDATLEKIFLEHLKADTPPEKIAEAISALKGLKIQDEDTIYDQLKSLGLKTYIDVGITLNSLAVALLPYYLN